MHRGSKDYLALLPENLVRGTISLSLGCTEEITISLRIGTVALCSVQLDLVLSNMLGVWEEPDQRVELELKVAMQNTQNILARDQWTITLILKLFPAPE